MLDAPVQYRGNAQGSAARAVIPPCPEPTPRTTFGFAFLTAEGGQRYRIDELIREIGRRGRFSARLAPYAWGVGGFLIGAIFWYFVGFWSFLSTVVTTKGPEAAVSVLVRPSEVVAGAPNCTLLVLNRSTGRTTSVPCPEPLPAFDEARSARQDFAAAHLP
jgi:hypothetical protein